MLYLEVPFTWVDGNIPVPIVKLLETTDDVEFSMDALDAATVALLPVEKLAVTPPVKEEKSLYFPERKFIGEDCPEPVVDSVKAVPLTNLEI